MNKNLQLKKSLKLIREIQVKLDYLYKKNISRKYVTKKDFQIDPVTNLDIQTEKIIREKINNYFPNHNIVG